MIQNLTDDNFMAAINQPGIIVLDFWATWCVPCKAVSAFIERIQNDYPAIKFYKVDVDTCPHAAAYADVTNLPTVFIVRDGIPIATIHRDFQKVIKRELDNAL